MTLCCLSFFLCFVSFGCPLLFLAVVPHYCSHGYLIGPCVSYVLCYLPASRLLAAR